MRFPLVSIPQPGSYRQRLHLTMKQSLSIPLELQQLMGMVPVHPSPSQSISLTLKLKEVYQLKTGHLCSQKAAPPRGLLLKTRKVVSISVVLSLRQMRMAIRSHTASVVPMWLHLVSIAVPDNCRQVLHLTMRKSLPIPSPLQHLMTRGAVRLSPSQSISLTLKLKEVYQLKTVHLCLQMGAAPHVLLLKTLKMVPISVVLSLQPMQTMTHSHTASVVPMLTRLLLLPRQVS